MLPQTTPTPIWIDTDPSVGLKYHDLDDGIALLLAFKAPQLAIRGISTVFGNADAEYARKCAQYATENFASTDIPVYGGAHSHADLNKPTEASEALAAALKKERLTIIAIGPATNIATAITTHPEIISRIDRIVVQSGRRPEKPQHLYIFGKIRTGWYDFNFEHDVEAYKILLESNIPLTIIPLELSSQMLFTREDYRQLKKGTEASKWIAKPMDHRLWFWKVGMGMNGFVPYDAPVMYYAIHPEHFTLQELPITIEYDRDDIVPIKKKPYLRLSPKIASNRTAEYAMSAHKDIKKEMLALLLS